MDSFSFLGFVVVAEGGKGHARGSKVLRDVNVVASYSLFL